jgi:predicted RNase H-like HicB family nuclease
LKPFASNGLWHIARRVPQNLRLDDCSPALTDIWLLDERVSDVTVRDVVKPVAGTAQGTRVMRYGVVIEQAAGNLPACVPDLPGCVATGQTVEEVTREIAEAIDFHLEGLKLSGSPIPEPTSIAEYVEAHFPLA